MRFPTWSARRVQADRTGESLAELNQDMIEFLTTKGVTQEERNRTIANSVQRLPGEFETAGAVLGAMMSMDVLEAGPTIITRRFRPNTGH